MVFKMSSRQTAISALAIATGAAVIGCYIRLLGKSRPTTAAASKCYTTALQASGATSYKAPLIEFVHVATWST